MLGTAIVLSKASPIPATQLGRERGSRPVAGWRPALVKETHQGVKCDA